MYSLNKTQRAKIVDTFLARCVCKQTETHKKNKEYRLTRWAILDKTRLSTTTHNVSTDDTNEA